MQISAISSVSLSAPSFVPSAAPAKAPANPQPTPAASAPAVSPAADDAPPTFLSEIYTTRVAGKSYAGEVTYASGIYSISVPNLPGSSVSASSLTAAENALNARIDILV